MKIRHIAAVILTHSEEFTNKAEILETIYWWIFDILLLGFLGKSLDATTNNHLLGTILIIAVITIRPTVVRGAITMGQLIIDELAGQTLLTTWSTPITFVEWTIASMIISFAQGAMRLALGYVLIYLFFGINIFVFGWTIFVLIPFFVLSGWIIGFVLSAYVYFSGEKNVMHLRTFTFSFIALSGVYAPVTTLPAVLQTISWKLPVTYLVAGLRAHVLEQAPLWPFLLKNLALNTLYLLPALALLYFSLRQGKKHGMAGLENN